MSTPRSVPPVTATVVPPGTEPSSSQFATLLAAIKQSEARLDQKLADFRSDMKETQEEAAAKAASRVRREKPYEYKKKAHEEQATFNEKVRESVREAQDALETAADSPAIERAKAALQQGSALLAERQKLIKIADRSVNGWSVVAEYTADELADDSDDEKRLEKAEKAAERKAGLKKRKRLPPTQKAPVASRAPRLVNAQPYGNWVPEQPHMQQGGGRRLGAANVQRAVGPCFACGDMGHLRTYCPKMQPQEKKWYPLLLDNNCVCGVCECDVAYCLCSVVSSDSCCGSVGRSSDKGPYSDVFSWDTCQHLDHYLDRLSSEGVLEGGVKDVISAVKGSIKRCISFWKDEIKAPAPILSIIESGYVLPLKSEPAGHCSANHNSAIKNSAFVDQSVKELVETECVVEVPELPYICSPLSVVESNSGKKRLVINLRYLNRFLWKQKFKYEDLRVAMLLLEHNDFMFSFDLKSGYHHVDIAQKHWRYLGFAWSGHYYVFTVLPFGLSSACYIFTKLVRPLVGYWRAKGLRIVVYLDDGLCTMESEAKACEASALVQSTLRCAGFVTNDKKSLWKPTQRLQWLGFVLDLTKGHVEVPSERLVALQTKLESVCALRTVCARQLASVVGTIMSMSLAFGPVSRFMTCSMYMLLESRLSWWSELEITQDARQELKFWRACMATYNRQPIWHSPAAVRIVYSDASDSGYGGYVVEHGASVAYGQWTDQESKQSSTWRELMAVLRVLQAFANKLKKFSSSLVY